MPWWLTPAIIAGAYYYAKAKGKEGRVRWLRETEAAMLTLPTALLMSKVESGDRLPQPPNGFVWHAVKIFMSSSPLAPPAEVEINVLDPIVNGMIPKSVSGLEGTMLSNFLTAPQAYSAKSPPPETRALAPFGWDPLLSAFEDEDAGGEAAGLGAVSAEVERAVKDLQKEFPGRALVEVAVSEARGGDYLITRKSRLVTVVQRKITQLGIQFLVRRIWPGPKGVVRWLRAWKQPPQRAYRWKTATAMGWVDEPPGPDYVADLGTYLTIQEETSAPREYDAGIGYGVGAPPHGGGHHHHGGGHRRGGGRFWGGGPWFYPGYPYYEPLYYEAPVVVLDAPVATVESVVTGEEDSDEKKTPGAAGFGAGGTNVAGKALRDAIEATRSMLASNGMAMVPIALVDARRGDFVVTNDCRLAQVIGGVQGDLQLEELHPNKGRLMGWQSGFSAPLACAYGVRRL